MIEAEVIVNCIDVFGWYVEGKEEKTKENGTVFGPLWSIRKREGTARWRKDAAGTIFKRRCTT